MLRFPPVTYFLEHPDDHRRIVPVEKGFGDTEFLAFVIKSEIHCLTEFSEIFHEMHAKVINSSV